MTGGCFTIVHIYYGRTRAFDFLRYREPHHLDSFDQIEEGLHAAVNEVITSPIVAKKLAPDHVAHFAKTKVVRWEEGHKAKDPAQRKTEMWGRRTDEANAEREAKRRTKTGKKVQGDDSDEEEGDTIATTPVTFLGTQQATANAPTVRNQRPPSSQAAPLLEQSKQHRPSSSVSRDKENVSPAGLPTGKKRKRDAATDDGFLS